LALSLLENPYTSNELGDDVIEFLDEIAQDKEALDILDSQNAFQSLLKFFNRHNDDAAGRGARLQQQLAKVASEKKVQNAEDNIKNALDRVRKYNSGETDSEELTEALNDLTEFAHVEKTVPELLNQKAHMEVLKSFQKELDKDFNQIQEEGLTESHEAALN